jgi:predicted alpha/beta hydrolase family esterase
MANPPILLLPGWQNSGPEHWQSRWETLYGDARVEQHDWMRPLRGDWIARLEDVLLAQSGPSILVAHSLGCLLAVAWASHSRHPHLVMGALLVAPPDPDLPQLQAALTSWSPVPMLPLPFQSLLLASQDDPYCSTARARGYAAAWGSEFIDYGARGHINAESGLGDWPQGRSLLARLQPLQAGQDAAGARLK